jgi:flagellar biosynthesis repressor protein FlbT
MKSTFKVALKANERIYINGAVLSVDRKTCIEFLNNVDFLLENHVLQTEDADTALKQIYFAIQIMLMAPSDTQAAQLLFQSQLASVLQVFSHQSILAELKNVDRLVHEKHYYEAMKSLRALFALEAEILGRAPPPCPSMSVSTAAA